MAFSFELTGEQIALREKVHTFARDVNPIFEGTSEIQRLVIGRALRAQANTDPLDQRMEAPR